MKVLLLGYSSIARRRVLPALGRLGVAGVDIASVSTAEAQWYGAGPGRLFRQYGDALRESDASVVYISTINTLHTELAEQALIAGFHVIIDKPACLTLAETKKLIELAKRQHRCLAEATVYSFHPQLATALQEFSNAGSSPQRLVATFSFPPLLPDNFRYRGNLGGGALLDLGPYAVSPGRIVFGACPTEIVARPLATQAGVETAFTVMALYPGERTLVGTFGYTTGYINRLDILGPRMTVSVDRVFTPPPDAEVEVRVCHAREQRIRVAAADSFERFLAEFFVAVNARDYVRFSDPMLLDAEVLERLRHSASGQP